jgi:hypothetical protein
MPNVYEYGSDAEEPGAQITIIDGTQQETTLEFDGSAEAGELKRISVFDSAVAQALLIDSGPLGFKPAGFDVFPEMARVYGQITIRLLNDIKQRTRDNMFIKSFIGPETKVSQFVAALDARTDIEKLRALAVFGEGEEARLVEVQRLKRELETKSVPEAIKQLEEAKRSVGTLKQRLATARDLLTDDRRQTYREELADFGMKVKTLAETGSGSFRHAALRGVGSPEWEKFLGAARDLAALEDEDYPRDTDHCLLCHRPLDEASVTLIRRFWGFLAGDARREVERASAALDGSVKALKAMQLGFFAEDTNTHGHVMRLNPEMAKQITALLGQMDNDRNAIVGVLEAFEGEIPQSELADVSEQLKQLGAQIDADITTLKAEKVEDALKKLEAERLTLRHRQVLNQLRPDVEAFVGDLVWAATASGAPKGSLNPRPLTEKEKELFNKVIAEKYREQLAEECDLLNCNLPVEFQTRGQQGETVRSLRVGGHPPDKILSEGEQRAVALADFLTEVGLNPSNAGIVLDDPVTSQDHDRKERIARRSVAEAKNRQVVIFTHDLVFLTMLSAAATDDNVEMLTHWVERDGEGRPGQISLDDCPAATPQYRNTEKAVKTLAEAKRTAGSKRVKLIQRGMGELRRTVEEIIPHFLFKQVVTRWNDRIIVTGLKNINWDEEIVTDIISAYEDLSAYIEGHTHTEEKAGAPPEPKHLEEQIARVNELIKRAKKTK